MKQIKNILVVSPDYPYKEEYVYPFVQNLCNELARQGYTVVVLSAQSITSAIIHNKKIRPKERQEEVGTSKVSIYQPITVTFPYRFWRLYNYMTRWGTMKFLKKMKFKPDIVYCHFWRSAYLVLPYIKHTNLPLFVATGEGALFKIADVLGTPEYLEISKYLSGVISVSKNNKDISSEIGILGQQDCLVAPNAVDNNLYHKNNKDYLRDKYNYSKTDFIVAFIGAFNERKGSLRLSKAIDKVGNVKSFFIGGAGESALEGPKCEGILYQGKLPHDVIPDYLNMADIFVLPTLNEGCCNAIVEALACGLPIVSSDRPFNYDILNKTNSILVDPMNINEIADAIRMLKENSMLRARLSEGALNTAKDLTINRRATKIMDFIKQHI